MPKAGVDSVPKRVETGWREETSMDPMQLTRAERQLLTALQDPEKLMAAIRFLTAQGVLDAGRVRAACTQQGVPPQEA